MIDTKAPPLHVTQFAGFSVPVAARTALLFNTLAIAAAALAALLPLAVALYWLLVSQDDVPALMGFAPEILGDLDPLRRMLAVAISVATVTPLAWALFRLRVCFTAFAKGQPFAAHGIAGLRDFATGVAIAAVAKPIGYTLMTLVLSWTAPAGMRQMAIQIDSDMLIMALFAATIASLGWAMEKAAAIAEENSQFV